MASEQQFTITDGPAKFDLMLSVFEGKVVFFTVSDGHGNVGYQGNHFSVQPEDGSHESWILSGVLYLNGGRLGQHFKGYYHSRTRTGNLRFV